MSAALRKKIQEQGYACQASLTAADVQSVLNSFGSVIQITDVTVKPTSRALVTSANCMTTAQFVTPAPISKERMSHLIGKGIDPDVASIDLEMVKMKMAEPEEGTGWPEQEIEQSEIEYKRWLTLCRRYPYPQHSIVPSSFIDTIWHYHILDTRAYHADCERVFGHYFHHFPYFGLRGEEDAQNLINSFEKTKNLYEVTYGENMLREGASNCDRDCQGRCWHACKSD